MDDLCEAVVTPAWTDGMVFGLSHDDDPSEYFDAPERRVPVSARVDESIKQGIELLIPLWRSRAIALGRDPEMVDQAHVIRRLLRVGVEGALAQALKQAGLKQMPRTPDEWKQLEKSLEKLTRESR